VPPVQTFGYGYLPQNYGVNYNLPTYGVWNQNQGLAHTGFVPQVNPWFQPQVNPWFQNPMLQNPVWNPAIGGLAHSPIELDPLMQQRGAITFPFATSPTYQQVW
jgi:hypothetical protein